MIDKKLPYDTDSEEALVGSFLIDGKCISKVISFIKEIDFYSQRNARIYRACVSLYSRFEAINYVTVNQELSRQGKIEEVGGLAYLDHCMATCPTSLDVEYYGNIVYRLSVSRKMIDFFERMSEVGYSAPADISLSIDDISNKWKDFRKENILNNNKLITPLVAGNDILQMRDIYANPANVPSWGYLNLDEITGGLFPEYVIIAGRPSVGKTQVAHDISEKLSLQNKKVLYASAEMSKMQIYERKIASYVGQDILSLRKHGLNETGEDRLMDLVKNVGESNIYYLADLKEGLYLRDIQQVAITMLEKDRLDAIVVDHLGALKDCYEGKDNQSIRVSKVSNKIQDMVHDLQVPIIVLSQLNREVEHRIENNKVENTKSKIPQLSDLRDSGSLEQDADVVFMGWRDELEDGTLSLVLNLAMRKNRQLGAKPEIQLYFNEKNHCYEDCIQKYENENYQSGLRQ